jgi:hypothetical protein
MPDVYQPMGGRESCAGIDASSGTRLVSPLTGGELVAPRRVAKSMSTRFVLLLIGLVLAAAIPTAAAAQSGRNATRVYVATLNPVQTDVGNYSATTGRATLRFAKRRGRLTVTARALAPRRVHRLALVSRRCTGPRIRGWANKRLRSNRAGRARTTVSGRRFTINRRVRRYVVLYQPGSRQPLLCGRLRARAAR